MVRRKLACWAVTLGSFVTASAGGREMKVAADVIVIPGEYAEGSQPDGNTVIFAARDGLIVMDTGRHTEHTQQILDYASRVKRPINAIINSHWHLDHIGGNPRIRAAYPDAHIHASGALGGALQGFLADYRRDLEGALQKMPDDPQAPAWKNELAIIAAAPQSMADDLVEVSGNRVIAGRKLALHLETHSVTAGDVWVFDAASGVLAAGDLVTLPVPFLDTACPSGWKTALDHVAREQFKTLIPGHGAPMQRAAFETYRSAYGNLLACAEDHEESSQDCIEAWIHDAGSLIPDAEQARARKMIEYYVGNVLRGKAERIVKLCAA